MTFWTVQPEDDAGLRAGKGLFTEQPEEYPDARRYLGQLVLSRTYVTNDGRLDDLRIYHIDELNVMAITALPAQQDDYDVARSLGAPALPERAPDPTRRTCILLPAGILQAVFDIPSPEATD